MLGIGGPTPSAAVTDLEEFPSRGQAFMMIVVAPREADVTTYLTEPDFRPSLTVLAGTARKYGTLPRPWSSVAIRRGN